MCYVSERQADLILAWVSGRIPNQEFARDYQIALKKLDELGPRILVAALQSEETFDVEYGLLVGFQCGVTRAYLPALLELASAPWHRQHAKVVEALAELRAPESVSALHGLALAQFPYLSADKTCALAVQAIEALGRIDSAAAIDRLAQLQTCGQRILEKQAKKQLQRSAQSANPSELQ